MDRMSKGRFPTHNPESGQSAFGQKRAFPYLILLAWFIRIRLCTPCTHQGILRRREGFCVPGSLEAG